MGLLLLTFKKPEMVNVKSEQRTRSEEALALVCTAPQAGRASRSQRGELKRVRLAKLVSLS